MPRPPFGSPEWLPHFLEVVNSSKNAREAAQELGYTAPASVRYHLKKFGIKVPDHWYPRPNPRPSARGPEFTAYFQAVLNSSRSASEAAEAMGYASPNTVMHHMKRLSVEAPEHWVTRQDFESPEWAELLREVVRNSQTRPEAARVLGYNDPKTVGHHMQRLGIERPPQWDRRPWIRELTQRHIPEVIIPTTAGRCWVAGLGLGESCIQSLYRRDVDTTFLEFDTAMVDPGPIFKLSEYYGMPPPAAPIKNHDWRPQWRKNISGLRALRVLKEVMQYLVGEKLREAQRAQEFFSPYGLHRGCYRNGDIWPRQEFPLRSKRRGSNYLTTYDTYSLTEASGWKPDDSQIYFPLKPRPKIPEVIIASLEERAWVGGLTQGEGSILTSYARRNDSTGLVVGASMTDRAPIMRFFDLVGLPRPPKPKPSHDRTARPKWCRWTTGLRALRLLHEIRPFLVGEKQREADKGLALFGPGHGYVKGCFRASDVWPTSEFPLRNHNSGGGLRYGG